MLKIHLVVNQLDKDHQGKSVEVSWPMSVIYSARVKISKPHPCEFVLKKARMAKTEFLSTVYLI